MPALDEGMPFMVIPAAMKQRLQAIGYSAADLSDMRPADAHAILTASPEGHNSPMRGTASISTRPLNNILLRKTRTSSSVLWRFKATCATSRRRWPHLSHCRIGGWKWEWKTTKRGEGKWTKPPINAARTNEYAKTNDLQSLHAV